MNNKVDTKFLYARINAIKTLKSKGCQVVHTLLIDEILEKCIIYNISDIFSLCNLNMNASTYSLKTLGKIHQCDTVYVCKGWQEAKYCKIIYMAALAYGLNIIYEE